MKPYSNRSNRLRAGVLDPAHSVTQITLHATVALLLTLSFVFVAGVGAQSRAAVLPTTPADVAYDRAAKAWSALRTVEATFEQSIMNPLLARTVTSRGTFLQQRPSLIAITFTDPVGDRIVSDGKSLWVYLPSSTPGQVLRLPADAEGAVVTDMLGQLLDTPRKTFVISGGEPATINGRATRRVQIVPRQPGTVTFHRAMIWLDEAEARPVRVQFTDSQGVERTITLTSWKPGVPVAKDAFRFEVPRGVRIVENITG